MTPENKSRYIEWLARPISPSQLGSWEYDKDGQWFPSYILNQRSPASAAMLFGSKVGKSIEKDEVPMVPQIVRYPKMEYELRANLGKLRLIGYADSYYPEKKLLREYKTSQNDKRWTQATVDTHGQLIMYALLLFLQDKVKPEDLTIHLDYIPVYEGNDLHIHLPEIPLVYPFKRKQITAADILRYSAYIQETRAKMEIYAKEKLSE